MPTIRRYDPGDDAALDDICVRTGDAGRDATGHHGDDDALLPDVFVRPYVRCHPETALVLESDDGRVIGYAVAAPDTDAFERWFRNAWWPARRGAHDPADPISQLAAARRPGAEPAATRYPAHLHIDLLPEAQGRGWGRWLIEALVGELGAVGVSGVHLVASADNAGALAFYPRVGFARIAEREGVVVFARAV